MRRHPPHPDDLAMMRRLTSELRTRRLDLGVSLPAMARRVGTSAPRLCRLELHPHCGMLLPPLHRAAAGVGADLTFDPVGLDEPADPLAATMAALYARTGNPRHLGAHLMARVRAARLQRGVSLAEVGGLLGCDPACVIGMEQPEGALRMSTAMRMCRALGGALGIDLVDVEEVADAA